jgi:hypothetical protein
MELIHHLKSAKYLQPSYPSLGYMSCRSNAAPVFLVNLNFVALVIKFGPSPCYEKRLIGNMPLQFSKIGDLPLKIT